MESSTARAPPPAPADGLKLLTRTDLKNIGITLSNTQLLRLEAKQRFPRRLYLTPARVVWLATEIHEWIRARAAERAHRIYSTY